MYKSGDYGQGRVFVPSGVPRANEFPALERLMSKPFEPNNVKQPMIGIKEVEFLEEHAGVDYMPVKQSLLDGEVDSIPFWSFLVSNEPPTDEDIQRGNELEDIYEREG